MLRQSIKHSFRLASRPNRGCRFLHTRTARRSPMMIAPQMRWSPLRPTYFLVAFRHTQSSPGGSGPKPVHFRKDSTIKTPPRVKEGQFEDYVLPHPVWTREEVDKTIFTHRPPTDRTEKAAYYTVQTMRFTWDIFSGYKLGHDWGWIKMTKNMWLLRLVFLESVAGVPGMMFSMARHLRSLRTLERDYGWINSLLSEAENERLHLLTFMNLYEPSRFFRFCVVCGQGIMSNFFFVAYLIHPRFCHRVVGYLEEEAVMTYTKLIESVKAGEIPEFLEPGSASNLAKAYWQLDDDASWLDVIEQIRSDEAHHRDVNHTLAPLSDKHGPESANPFRNWQQHH